MEELTTRTKGYHSIRTFKIIVVIIMLLHNEIKSIAKELYTINNKQYNNKGITG